MHRDVKPANVLLGQGEHAYLTDFGLTKHVLSEAGATKPGHWVGTLDFVAPEQIRGERVDARADVYALGCVLHYMLAGRPPFTPDGDEAKLWAHLSEPSRRVVSDAAPGVPDGVRRRHRPGARQGAGASASSPPATSAARRPPRPRAGAPPGSDTVVATGAAAPIEIDTRTAGTALAPPPPAAEPAARRRPRALAVAAAAAALLAAAAVAGLAMRGERASSRARREPPARRAADAEVDRDPDRRAPEHRPRRRRPRLDGPLPRARAWTRSTPPRGSAPQPAAGDRRRAHRPRGRPADDLWALAARDAAARAPRRPHGPAARRARAAARRRPTRSRRREDAVYVAVTQPELDPGDQILEFDPRTGELRRTIDVRDGVRRLELARGRLWLLASNPARARSGSTWTTRQPPPRRRSSPPPRSTSRSAPAYLWATLSDADQLARVDPRGGKPATFATGRGPAGVAVRKGTVWVANRTASTLTRIDVRTGRPVRAGDPGAAEPVRRRGLRRRDLGHAASPTGKIARVTGLDG